MPLWSASGAVTDGDDSPLSRVSGCYRPAGAPIRVGDSNPASQPSGGERGISFGGSVIAGLEWLRRLQIRQPYPLPGMIEVVA